VHRAQRQQMQSMAAATQERMLALARALKLEFEQSQGYMVLFRTARDLSRYRPGLAALVDAGTAHEVVDAARARVLEPALTAATPLHAALLLPTDGVGNCRQFAHQLKAHAQRLGADFHLGVEVTGVSPGQRIGISARHAAESTPRTQDFDAVVIAAGTVAARMGAPLGIRLPIVAVHGYSLTAPVCHREAEPDPGPRCGVMDARHGIAISRLGQRIRVAGISEIGGHPDRMDRNALQSLYDVLEDWFPGAAEIAKAQHWKGARPMLPDGAPIVGASAVPGIWLNVGHGSHGWSLACGAARTLADQMVGRTPQAGTPPRAALRTT
jgi:D-amino-acid dehydrogenase